MVSPSFAAKASAATERVSIDSGRARRTMRLNGDGAVQLPFGRYSNAYWTVTQATEARRLRADVRAVLARSRGGACYVRRWSVTIVQQPFARGA